MKKLVLLAVLATAAWSVDFSQMSTEELMKLRGTLSQSERPAFRAEMQKRMQSMSPAERQQLMQGRGMGGMKGQGMNKGRGGGKGMLSRPTFASFDSNGDGKVSKQEFYDAQAAKMTQKANEGKLMKNAQNAPTFEMIDSNKDGSISPSELSSYQDKKMQQMVQKRGL